MSYLDQYVIPIHGIQHGEHLFDFEIDSSFFSHFEDSPIESGNFKVNLNCDKRENEFLLSFQIEGHFRGDCDRCLAEIDVPTEIDKLIWVKYSDQADQFSTEADLIYMDPSEHIFNVSGLIYELIILSIPIVKRYDCENDPNPKCDFKVLEYLGKEQSTNEGNSIANKLKNLKNQ